MNQPVGQTSMKGRTQKLALWRVLLVNKNTLFLSSKPAHMHWESPENKFPKKTYGAYLLRKSANKTN